MTRDVLHLAHMAECIERIERYTTEGRDSFLRDERTQDAVIRNLQVLGESARRISEGARDSASDIPWAAVSGLRNVLVHDYLRVNLEHVWTVIERDLPVLREALKRLRRTLGQDN